jgi:hypothetical protein
MFLDARAFLHTLFKQIVQVPSWSADLNAIFTEGHLIDGERLGEADDQSWLSNDLMVENLCG